MNRICLWPLRRDDHSGVLIGAGGTRRSDWPAHVLANDLSTTIDRWPERKERSIARVQGQVAASCYRVHKSTALIIKLKCFFFRNKTARRTSKHLHGRDKSDLMIALARLDFMRS